MPDELWRVEVSVEGSTTVWVLAPDRETAKAIADGAVDTSSIDVVVEMDARRERLPTWTHDTKLPEGLADGELLLHAESELSCRTIGEWWEEGGPLIGNLPEAEVARRRRVALEAEGQQRLFTIEPASGVEMMESPPLGGFTRPVDVEMRYPRHELRAGDLPHVLHRDEAAGVGLDRVDITTMGGGRRDGSD